VDATDKTVTVYLTPYGDCRIGCLVQSVRHFLYQQRLVSGVKEEITLGAALGLDSPDSRLEVGTNTPCTRDTVDTVDTVLVRVDDE
jgi:hypothetical protein